MSYVAPDNWCKTICIIHNNTMLYNIMKNNKIL